MTNPTPFQKALVHSMGTKFSDMTGAQKALFILKLMACIGTFGFAFPNVQSD